MIVMIINMIRYPTPPVPYQVPILSSKFKLNMISHRKYRQITAHTSCWCVISWVTLHRCGRSGAAVGTDGTYCTVAGTPQGVVTRSTVAGDAGTIRRTLLACRTCLAADWTICVTVLTRRTILKAGTDGSTSLQVGTPSWVNVLGFLKYWILTWGMSQAAGSAGDW